jgi:hypothetical protein
MTNWGCMRPGIGDSSVMSNPTTFLRSCNSIKLPNVETAICYDALDINMPTESLPRGFEKSYDIIAGHHTARTVPQVNYVLALVQKCQNALRLNPYAETKHPAISTHTMLGGDMTIATHRHKNSGVNKAG